MEIRRVTAQGAESLDQCYARLIRDPEQAKCGALMMKLIDTLASQPPDRLIWAATNQLELMFLLDDDPRAPAFATVKAQAHWYFVECAMPKSIRPWPDAWVKGHTSDVNLACRMILTGWNWSQEIDDE